MIYSFLSLNSLIMEIPIPPKFESIFRVCFVLIFVGGFSAFLIGHAIEGLHDENVLVQEFVASADNLQINFEKSLSMYTENTQASMDYLNQLRPADENAYIQFISAVENLGLTQALPLTLQTIDEGGVITDDTGSHYIDYKIQFYGRDEQVPLFLTALEQLPYFTRVMDIHYQSFEFFSSSKDADTPNIVLTVRLYVK